MLTHVNVVKSLNKLSRQLTALHFHHLTLSLASSSFTSFTIFFITTTPLPRTLILKGESRKSLAYFICKFPCSIVRRTIFPLNQQLGSNFISHFYHTPIQNHPRFQSLNSICHRRQWIKLPIITMSSFQKRYMKDIMYLCMARQLQLICHLPYLIFDFLGVHNT